MLKFLTKFVGWIFLAIIGFGLAVMGLGMLTGIAVGLVAVIFTYVIPCALLLFIAYSVLSVLWGLAVGDD
ncbi:MAG: hypothetical protein AAFQ63_12195 [Cyanobacteria bacterium J06621_11]